MPRMSFPVPDPEMRGHQIVKGIMPRAYRQWKGQVVLNCRKRPVVDVILVNAEESVQGFWATYLTAIYSMIVEGV